MADIFRLPNRYQYPPRDWRVAAGSQAWVTGSGIYALTSVQPMPPGAQRLPEKIYSLDRRTSINSQQWVLPASALNISRNAVLPPGVQSYPTRYLFKDRTVAVNSQQWMVNFNIVQISSAPSPIQPPGVQHYPTRIRAFDRFAQAYSQHWMNFPSRAQRGNAHFDRGNSGVFLAVGTVSNRSVMGITGSGTLNWVGRSTFAASFTMTGAGGLTAVGRPASASSAVATFAGSALLTWSSLTVTGSAAIWGGSGVFNAQSAGALFSHFNFTGKGGFAAHGQWTNILPFNDALAWSIMFYGPTIDGVAYDPISHNMKVFYANSNGQYIMLQNLPITITNVIQFQFAKHPEEYVLQLIKSNTH